MSVLCIHFREARTVCCPKHPAFTKRGESLGNRFVIRRCRCSSVSNSEVGFYPHDKRDMEASGQGGTGASHICCNFCLFCFCFQDKILLCNEADLNSKPTCPPRLNLLSTGILGLNHNPLFSVSRKGENQLKFFTSSPT